MDGDLQPQEPRKAWQAVAAGMVVLVTLALVGGLVAYRYFSTRPQHATGSVVGTVTVAPGVALQCTLPVTVYGRTEAMISFPDGKVTVQSALPAVNGKSFGSYSYDTQLKKWVPVQRQWVSADGKYYAFSTSTNGVPGEPPTGDVRIRDIATGHDRTAWKGEGSANVVGWAGSTLYFYLQSFKAQPAGPELWAVDISGANLRRVGPNPPPPAPKPGQPYGPYFGGGGVIGGGALWGITMSHIPMPPMEGSVVAKGPGGGPDTITRMDLASGAVATWYTAPEGSFVSVVGIDAAGHPLIAQAVTRVFTEKPPADYVPPPPTYLLLTGPGQAQPIPGSAPALSSTGVDSHGTWFSGAGQLWLLSGDRFQKVADIPDDLFPPPTPPPGAVMPSGIPQKAKAFVMVAGACA